MLINIFKRTQHVNTINVLYKIISIQSNIYQMYLYFNRYRDDEKSFHDCLASFIKYMIKQNKCFTSDSRVCNLRDVQCLKRYKCKCVSTYIHLHLII